MPSRLHHAGHRASARAKPGGENLPGAVWAWIVLGMGQVIAHDWTFAGLRMQPEDWHNLDQSTRLELLRVLAETSPSHADDSDYESYELIVEVAAELAADSPANSYDSVTAMAR